MSDTDREAVERLVNDLYAESEKMGLDGYKSTEAETLRALRILSALTSDL